VKKIFPEIAKDGLLFKKALPKQNKKQQQHLNYQQQ
jgi:hypothetical protein